MYMTHEDQAIAFRGGDNELITRRVSMIYAEKGNRWSEDIDYLHMKRRHEQVANAHKVLANKGF